MKVYDKSARSMARWRYGVELLRGLKSDKATADAMPALKAINDRLDAAHKQTQSWNKVLWEKRIDVRWADGEVDPTLRDLFRKAESLDGFPSGPISKAVFPDGLTPAVKSRGRAQLKPAQAVIKRLDENPLPGVVDLRAMPEAAEARAKTALLEAVVKEYDALLAQKAEDFRKEKLVQEEHLREVHSIKGKVTAAHPQNTRRQNLIFPPAPPKPKKEKKDDSDEDELDFKP